MTKESNKIILGEYEIVTKPFVSPSQPTDCYEFFMNCYWGDMDGTEKHSFFIPNDPLLLIQKRLEIYVLKNQFTSGRGGVRTYFDQTNYLRSPDTDYADTDNYWDWLENYPYHYDLEQNFTLSKLQIFYYNKNSEKFEVNIEIPVSFTESFTQNNQAYFEKYGMNKLSSMEDEDFEAYRQMALSLVEAELLQLKIDTTNVPIASLKTKNKI